MNAIKRSTIMRNLIGGAAICLGASPLHAGELSAMAGETIELGRFHGVVYHTSEDDGHRVVATLADGEAALPVRFSATLADNQSATISVPGELGEPGHSLEISRSGDKLTVTKGEPAPSKSIEVDTGFGPAIGDGRSLDLNLVTFNEDLNQRGEPPFISIAREAGGTGLVDTGFGPAIGDGRSLDLNLDSFNEDLNRRGELLFIRIAQEAGGTSPFSDVAAVPPAPFDPLGGDSKKPSSGF